jgi:glycosyltransferase involved in cell wall biosynthesis
MRILSLIHLYPPHHLGGYEIACRGVMERFNENGHDVRVLTSDTRLSDTDPGSSPNSIEVWRQLRTWFDIEGFAPLRPSLRTRISIERHNERAVRRAVASFRPDVASIWSMGYMSWSALSILEELRIPLVVTVLDDWICWAFVYDAWMRVFDRRPWARPLGELLGLKTRLPTFTGARVNVASRTIASQIAEYGRWKFPDAPVVPIGVDTNEIPIVEPEDREWDWKLLYVGRVVANKGVLTLVRALSHLPAEASLEVVGHAPAAELEAMTTLAEQLGVRERISFSRAPRETLAARYRKASLLVFPSEWAEPFGIVPLEAMACCVPVVATGTGGSGEYLVDGENCVLFSPGDPIALADAVRRVAEDKSLRSRIVAGGTRTARVLTMDRYAAELEKLHEAAGTQRHV